MKSLCILALSALAPALHGATLVNEGVLGNSGEQGSTLVRFSREPADGVGVVCDRFGALWDRAGRGTLNRYAIDGRLLAQYKLPAESDRADQMTLVGETLVLQIRGKLYALALDAPAGSEAQPLKRASDAISFGVKDGQIATRIKDEIFLYDPKSGAAKPAGQGIDAREIELGPDGAVYAVFGRKLHKFIDGAEVTAGWPVDPPGMRPQLIERTWFGHAYHTTIRRFTETMAPQPGVVLGGASGSVIGHLEKNSELHNGCGLARLRENLYAASGNTAVLHLLEWKAKPQQFEIIRRIGAVPNCRGLALDTDGNIWHYAGSWRWTDRPDAPLREGVNAPDHPGLGQPAMLEDGSILGFGSVYGKGFLLGGKLNTEVTQREVKDSIAMAPKDVVANALVMRNKKRSLLLLDKSGRVHALGIDGSGKYEADLGTVSMSLSAPLKTWTSLVASGPETLIAAADGAVIELEAQGSSEWKETRRWNSWGSDPAEKFGATIFVSTQGGRLWVSDRERHRVLCFDAATWKPLATFGTTDRAGDTLELLSQPEVIAGNGSRAVVYDSGNQRLVKLRLP